MELLNTILHDMTLINNFLLLAFFFTFAIVFWLENKNEKSPLQWTDMLMDKKENRLSLTKLGQFWGIAISSWMAVFLVQKIPTDQIAGLFPVVFGTWLTFLVANVGIKAFSGNKDKLEATSEKEVKEDETK